MAELKDRYATALLEMSLERGELEETLVQANLLRGWLREEQLADLLANPHIPKAAKRELLENVFTGRLSNDLLGLLYLVVEKGRETVLPSALDAYITLGDRHRGRAAATLVSAVELRPEQVSAVKQALSKKLGKEIELSFRQDSALIGGFYVYVDGRLIDCSVRSRLQALKESLIKRGVK